MERIHYNFDSFIEAFNNMKNKYTTTPADLRSIKNELNKFFKDSTCKEVLYTNNTDRMFFGMKIIAMIDADDIYDYLIEDEPKRIGKYIVEIDSHLLNPVLNLSAKELTAILIHEVGHMVGDSEPIENARNALNAYLASNNEYVKVSQSIHYKEILAYGLKDYLSKTRSMFYTGDISELYADEFVVSYGFGDDLASAYRKICSNNMKLYENSEVSKFITFGWTLSLYKNIRIRRIGCIRTLTRAKQLTGSKLEQMEIDNVIRRIKRIDDDVVMESSGVMDTIRLKMRERMRKSRLNSLRTIDSAFYELNMQIRNVEDENDALYMMRQINSNLAIIDEYKNSSDCDEYEKERWDQVMEKFMQLRDKLSRTAVYKSKNYGLFVNYPEIVENRY